MNRTSPLLESKPTTGKEVNNLMTLSKLGLWLLISLVFTIIQIQQSLHEGRLAFPITYDDVVYFNDAVMRLKVFYDGGLLKSIEYYIENPPHSLLSVLIPFLGFALLGVQDWAPYLMNFILVFLILIFIDYLTDGLSIYWKIFIALSALAWPVMGHLVVECRPDIFCGFLTASFAILITEKPWLTANPKRHFIIGGLIGAALLTKATVSPVTLVIALSAMALVTLIEVFALSHEISLVQIIKPGIRSLGLSILIALPYYLVAFRQVVKYVYKAQFGSNKMIWQQILPFLDDIKYYLTGQGGNMMLNHYLYFWLLCALSTVIAIYLRKDWRSMIRVPALAGTMLIAYTIVTSSDHKSPFLGVSVTCFLLFTYVNFLVYLVQSIKILKSLFLRRLTYYTLISFLAISLVAFKWPVELSGPQFSSLDEARYYHNELSNIYEDVNKNIPQNKLGRSTIYISSVARFLTPTTLEYEFRKRDNFGFNFSDNDLVLSVSLNNHLDNIKKSDFVITFNSENTEVPYWIPSRKVLKEILEFLETEPGYSLIHKYKSPYSEGTVFLFAHKSTGIDP